MRSPLFITAFALTAVGAVAQPSVRAQLAPPATPTAHEVDFGIGLFVAEREVLLKLSRAKEHLAQQQQDARYSGEAITLLHEVLQSEEESALSVDKDRTMLRNLRLEAERVIGGLPGSARESYDKYFDADARQMLGVGIEEFDLNQLAETSRRFFYTRSGYEATYLVAMSHLDHGRPFDAAAWFQRLRDRRNLPADEQATLALQSAMAWALADAPEMALSCLLDLKQLSGGKPIQLGGRTLKLFEKEEDALAWLDVSVLQRPPGKANSPRNEKINPEVFASASNWSVATSSWQVPVEEAPFSGGVVDVSRQLRGIENDFDKKGRAAIPSVRPVIVDDVALVRTQSHLRAYDLLTGELAWQTKRPNVLEQVRCGTIPPLPGDTGSILDPMLRDRLFANPTYGRLSTDRGLVFCVEDLGFVTVNPNQYGRPQSNHPLSVKDHNHLCAYAIDNGRLAWSLGGKRDESKLGLAGHFFLGAPLPLAGHLYCLAEVDRQIQLLVLNATTGAIDWSKPLQSVAYNVATDAHRGRAGLTPAYENGIIVCPTGSGLIAGVDLATRQILWSYRYRDLEEGSPQDRARRIMMARILAARGQAPTAPVKTGDWYDSTPLIDDGRVFVTPREGSDLLCLNLADGAIAWHLPKENREYLAGTYHGNLVIVGSEQIELISRKDGTSVWAEPVKIARPSGVGILDQGRLLLPHSNGTVAVVDLESAKISSKIQFTDGATNLGNLAYSSEFVLSQNALGINCFNQPKANNE